MVDMVEAGTCMLLCMSYESVCGGRPEDEAVASFRYGVPVINYFDAL
jgi:hypothetical protein